MFSKSSEVNDPIFADSVILVIVKFAVIVIQGGGQWFVNTGILTLSNLTCKSQESGNVIVRSDKNGLHDASVLVATTMAMPVMAADGDTVNVEFTTKIPVIRGAVPTSILAAVDPLEMNMPGTQIHSTAFTLANKSEVSSRN